MHINYKNWGSFYKMAKANNINTFAELQMYCKVWGIKNAKDLYYRLYKDYSEILYEQAKMRLEV